MLLYSLNTNSPYHLYLVQPRFRGFEYVSIRNPLFEVVTHMHKSMFPFNTTLNRQCMVLLSQGQYCYVLNLKSPPQLQLMCVLSFLFLVEYRVIHGMFPSKAWPYWLHCS